MSDVAPKVVRGSLDSKYTAGFYLKHCADNRYFSTRYDRPQSK
jgi:hypothetical protein